LEYDPAYDYKAERRRRRSWACRVSCFRKCSAALAMSRGHELFAVDADFDAIARLAPRKLYQMADAAGS
jgi:hypothetical protein